MLSAVENGARERANLPSEKPVDQRKMAFTVLISLAALLTAMGVLVNICTFLVKNGEVREYLASTAHAAQNVVFMCYRSADVAFAGKVRNLLSSNGFIVHMWDPERPFDNPVRAVCEHIDQASVVIMLKSSDDTPWLQAERRLAEVAGSSVVEVYPDQDLVGVLDQVASGMLIGRPRSLFPGDMADIARSIFGEQVGTQLVESAGLPEYDQVGFYAGAGAFLSLFFYGPAFYLVIIAFVLRYCDMI